MKKFIILAGIIFYANFLSAEDVNSGWEDVFSSSKLPYTSMTLIEKLNKDVDSVTPQIDGNNVAYLSSSSCLGSFGPAGAYGPLGLLGPIGSNTWDISKWFSFILVSYSDWQNMLKEGALSMEGPLGYKGPLATEEYYKGELFEENNFAVQLRSLGLWTVLGPIGPLGALGPLGPLGELGPMAANVDQNGQFLDKGTGAVLRDYTMQYSKDGKRTYELFENYNEDFAKNMTDNDTSFMVEGEFSDRKDDAYSFTSKFDQFVTILAVPLAQYENATLEVIVNPGNKETRIKSDSDNYIDFIQVAVRAGTKLKVVVHPEDTILNNSYRLFVVGGTEYLNKTNISGDHIKYC